MIQEEVIDPKSFGIKPSKSEQLKGGDAKYNAQIARAILAGRQDGDLAAIRDVVALNTAAALVAYDAAVMHGQFGIISDSLTSRISKALPLAYGSLDSGAAESVLDVWVSVSQRFALEAK